MHRKFFLPICLARSCAAIAAIIAFCACAVDEPEITEVKARRLFIQDEQGGFSRSLSVFALFNGGEVADDFALMTVTHEETGVFWELPASSSLMFSGEDEHFWVGSSRLDPIPSILEEENASADAWQADGFFPEGAYTVTADNAAGSSATASFELGASFYFTPQSAVFRLAGEGDDERWSVVLSQDISHRDISVYLFLIDQEGAPLSSVRITEDRFRGRRAEGKVSDLIRPIGSRRNNASVAISCYVEHPASSSAVLLFPLSLSNNDEK